MSKPAHERLKDQVKLLRSRAKLDTMTSEHEAQDHRDWLLADTLDAIADEVEKLEAAKPALLEGYGELYSSMIDAGKELTKMDKLQARVAELEECCKATLLVFDDCNCDDEPPACIGCQCRAALEGES